MTAPVVPPTLTSPPPAPDRADRVTFSARATALADFNKNVGVPEMQLAIDSAQTNAISANESAVGAASSAAASATSATNAAASEVQAARSAGAVAWVSGTTYAAGAVVWSPADGRIYRRRAGMGGAGATDPSADVTNWVLASGGWWGPITVLTVANNGATLASNATYYLDSTGGSFSLSMPVMAVGDWIKLVDVAGKLYTNPVTLTRNATNGNLAGYAEDRVLDVAFDSVEMVKTASYGVIEQ